MSRSIEQVISSGMCAGCGLCADTPKDMHIDGEGFARPSRHVGQAQINYACPGDTVWHLNKEAPYDQLWGPILSVATASSTNNSIRHRGSSGGVLTAMLQHLLSSGKVDAVIQVGADRHNPLRNDVFVHNSETELLENAGSRYAPSAPLAVIRQLAQDNRAFAFVGKPCDAAALRKFVTGHPDLEARFPFILSFMCAGVPSEKGTEAVLARMKLSPENVTRFRYRGEGWPGKTQAIDLAGNAHELSYNEAWGQVLNKHLQRRCKLCADGTGEAADLVCADAWYESEGGYPTFEEKEGRSLLIGRTRVGEELIADARGTGAVTTEPFDISDLEAIQPYQVNRKRSFLARSVVQSLSFGRPPRFPQHSVCRLAWQGGLLRFARTAVATALRRAKGRL